MGLIPFIKDCKTMGCLRRGDNEPPDQKDVQKGSVTIRY